jgi:hypothetical protein
MIDPHTNQPFGVRHWAVALSLWGLAAAAQPAPRVIDRAVASIEVRNITGDVERKVIAWSQLEFEARVLLVAAGGVTAAFAPLDQPVLEASLRAIMDQRLALLEADKLEAYPLEPGELERAIASFRGRFESETRFADFLGAHEADLNDLAEVLRRSLRAQRALEGKLRLRAQVSEGEARAWRTSHADYKDLPLEKVRAMLVQQRFDELVKKELADRRRQVDVRLLGPFAPKQADP